MCRRTNIFRGMVLAAGLVLAPVAALAATFDVSKQVSSVFGGNGFTGATIMESTLRPSWSRVSAGAFAVKGNLFGTGVQNFTAWCVDITTTLKLSSMYTSTTSPFTSGPIAQVTITTIERLFETGFKTLNLTSASQSAGFQLALWEVLYEKSGSYSLSSGNFKAKDSTAIAQAQALLAGLSGPVTQNYHMTFLQSNDPRATSHDGHYSQHLVTVSQVPLPAGGLLLLGGLGGLAALRRSKARKAA